MTLFGFDEFAGLVEVVVDDRIGGDAEGFVDGGQQLTGMHWVFVNGEVAVEQGQPTGRLEGRVLRRAARPIS